MNILNNVIYLIKHGKVNSTNREALKNIVKTLSSREELNDIFERVYGYDVELAGGDSNPEFETFMDDMNKYLSRIDLNVSDLRTTKPLSLPKNVKRQLAFDILKLDKKFQETIPYKYRRIDSQINNKGAAHIRRTTNKPSIRKMTNINPKSKIRKGR